MWPDPRDGEAKSWKELGSLKSVEPQTNLKSLPLLCDIKINPTHSNHLGLWTELSPQNSHVEAQTPNVTVFGERA